MIRPNVVRSVAFTALVLAGAMPALAQRGEWQYRTSLAAVMPSGDSDSVADLGTVLSLDTGPALALDASYGLSHTLAASFTLTGSYHSMETSGGLAGGLTAGDLWLGSATLTLQWRPGLMGPWHPYLGAGLSYAEPFAFDVDDEAAAIGLVDVEFDGDLGYVLQAGVMYDLDREWFLDLRFGYSTLTAEAHLTVDPGLPYDTVEMELDPWQVGLGVGTRF